MNDGGSQQGQQFTLTASKGMGGSRTAIINGQTVWSEGDKIYVSGDDGRVTGVLTLNPESIKDDPTRGTFTGFVFGDPEKLEYSVFPAPTNGTVIDLSTIVGGGEVDAPMIGAIVPNPIDGTDVHFENVCGVAPIVMNGYQDKQDKELVIQATNNGSAVKFLSKLDVTKVNLASDPLSFIIGTDETETITITNAKGGEMYVPYYLKSTLDDSDKIVMFTNGNDIVNKADLSNGFVGKVHSTTVVPYTFDENGNGVKNETTTPDLKTDGETTTAVVNQSQFSSINDEGHATSGETQYFNVSALVTKGSTTEEGKTETVVAEAIEVTLPKVAPATESEQAVEKSVEISFTNVTSSTTITIKEDSESTKPASIDNLTIVLPSGTTKEEAKEQVVIEMPNTTVTVKSADGNVLLIDEAVATTGENTFIISEDVFINGLWVRKGNVDVYGKVKNWIKRHNENRDEKTTITLYGNATVGNLQELEKDSKFIVKRGGAEEPEVPHVSTLEELQTAIASGATNIILTKTITLTDDTSLNLNGKTLTLSEDFEWVGNAAIVSNGYALTINGPIEGCQKTCIDKYLIEVKNASKVGLNNGELITFGVANAVKVVDTNFSVETSLIEAEDGFAVDVIAETKPVHVYLGTKYGAGIVGKVRFCNNYNQSGSRLEVRGESNIQGNLAKLGDNQEGLYIFVHPEVEVDHTSGWPIFVATVEDLQAELEKNQQAVINLAAPITITSDLDLKGNTLVVDEEVWMSQKPQPHAAITVTGTGDAPIVISNGQIHGTSSKFVGGFLIKATCKFNLKQVSLTAGQLLNGVDIVNSLVNIIESEITADKSSLHIFADTNNSVVQIVNSKIDSELVVFTNNYSLATETNPEVEPSALVVVEGSVVDSNIIIDGEYTKYLDIAVLDNGSFIKGDVVINGGNGPFELRVDEGGKVEGNNWPNPGQGGGQEPGGNPDGGMELDEATRKFYDDLHNPEITNITLDKPITLSEYVDLGRKTVSITDNFFSVNTDVTAAISFVSNDSEAQFGIENGTIKGSSTETGKYLIESSIYCLELNHGLNITAEGTLNGVHVTDKRCYVVEGVSISAENGHAIKMLAEEASFKLAMWNDVVVDGDVHLECNYARTDDSEYNSFAHLYKQDRENNGYDYAKINGNVIITGSQAEVVTVIQGDGEDGLNLISGEIIIKTKGNTGGKDFEFGQVW